MQKVAGKLVIPTAVAEESKTYSGTITGQIHLPQESWIQVESLQSEDQMSFLLPTLDRGEAAVIALALEKLGEIKAVKLLLKAMHESGIYFSQQFIDSVLRYVVEG
jgi:predicted nucleic acid-binding protein